MTDGRTRRARRAGLTAALAGLAALGLSACGEPSPGRGATGGAAHRWELWGALSAEQRAAIAARYRQVNRRPDAQRVLDAARAFAALDAERRARLRAIHELIEDVLRATPVEQRRWLEALPPEARALEVHRVARARFPDRLARF